MARVMAWMGILAIVILSVVPAADRPVTGAGQLLEHLTAFAIVGGAFALGYRLSLMRVMFIGDFLLCWNRIASSPPADQTCPGQ